MSQPGSDERGGYLRIKANADQQQAGAVLAELLLASPNDPIDVRAISIAQGHRSGYVAERVEEAVSMLVMLGDSERIPNF